MSNSIRRVPSLTPQPPGLMRGASGSGVRNSPVTSSHRGGKGFDHQSPTGQSPTAAGSSGPVVPSFTWLGIEKKGNRLETSRSTGSATARATSPTLQHAPLGNSIPQSARAADGRSSPTSAAGGAAPLVRPPSRPVRYHSVPFKFPTPAAVEQVVQEVERKEAKMLLASSLPTPYDFFFPPIQKNVVRLQPGEGACGFDEVKTPRKEKFKLDIPVADNLAKVAFELCQVANGSGHVDEEGWTKALKILTDSAKVKEVAQQSWLLFDGDRFGYLTVNSILTMLGALLNGEHAEAVAHELFHDFTLPQHDGKIPKELLDELRNARTERNGNTRAMILVLLKAIHALPRFACDPRQYLSFAEFKRFLFCQPDLDAIAAYEAQFSKKGKKGKSAKNAPQIPQPPSVQTTKLLAGEIVAAFLPKLFQIMQNLYQASSSSSASSRSNRYEEYR